jgi:hydrogenase/urease accessory protein HupE
MGEFLGEFLPPLGTQMGRLTRARPALLWLCLVGLIGLFWVVLPVRPAAAHGFETAYLELTEQPGGTWAILWKTPPALEFGEEGLGLGRSKMLTPVLPDACPSIEVPAVVSTPSTQVKRWAIDCGDRGLAGQSITFPGLAQNAVEVLLRVQWADGHAQTTLLPTGPGTFVIPTKTTVFEVGKTYLKLGVNHIFSGIDHLLFVLGLVLIVGRSWRLVKTITAFTVAHSITLGAATLGLVQVPQAPVEAVIALSILFLASELAHSRRGNPGLTEQYPWLVALTFGLLHGFGFAGALSEVGLPAQDIPPALLFFNVGVEVGQLTFVLAVLAVMGLLQRLGAEALPPWVGWLPTYGIGVMASFWCIQRVAAFWSSA